MTKSFSSKCIRNVYFNNRCCDCFNSIAYTDRSMGVSCGVKDDSIIGKPNFLNLINQFAFNVALILM